MQSIESIDLAQAALDDLGPFAPEGDLERLVTELPPAAGVYLSGYLAGIRGLNTHPGNLMELNDYRSGLQAGQDIKAAYRR